MARKRRALKEMQVPLGGDGSELGREMHPLLNNVVLRSIFQYCDFTEMKRNRLVCQLWLQASTAQWTKLTKTLTLLRGDDNTHPNDFACKTLTELQRICETATVPLNQLIVHRKFRFLDWTFDNGLIESLNLSESGSALVAETFLWTRIAPHLITDLTLERCRFPIELTVFTERFLKPLPNLEKLTVKDVYVHKQLMGKLGPRWNSISPGFVHRKLKYLFVKALKWQGSLAFDLVRFLNFTPEMKTVVLRGFDVSGLAKLLTFLDWASAWDSFEELDLLDFSIKAFDSGVFCLAGKISGSKNLTNLKVLHYDIGYVSSPWNTDLEQIQSIMKKTMTKLHLYRAPFLAPSNELFQSNLANISELHLWGNVVCSLDFLKYCPNLKVLVMITSCYEERYHGKRAYHVLQIRNIPRFYPLMNHDFVEKTTKHVEPMVHLTKLSIDWIPGSAKSWSKLGEWMPNLSSLKARICNPSRLGQIRKQWNSLECLELGHGTMITGKAVLKELPKFKKLNLFAWTSCPCTEKLWNESDLENLEKIRATLGICFYRRVINPWIPPLNLNEDFVFQNSWKRRTRNGCKICLQAEYEKMIVSGNTSEYLRMAEVFTNV